MGRSALLLGSTLFNFLAFIYLRLGEALAILLHAVRVAILAGPMLGEWVGWRRWIAIGVGFYRRVGGDRAGLRRADSGRRCSGRQRGLLRLLQHHHPDAGSPPIRANTTLFYSNMLGAAIMLPVLPFVWTPPQSILDGVLMVALGGVRALSAHYLLILAHRHAPASVLSSFAAHPALFWPRPSGFPGVLATCPTSGCSMRAPPSSSPPAFTPHRERKVAQGTVALNEARARQAAPPRLGDTAKLWWRPRNARREYRWK